MNSNRARAEERKFLSYPRAILIDPASLVVDPDSVPSKAYHETFKKLESRLSEYPYMGDSARQEDNKEIKVDASLKTSGSPDSF